MSILLVTISSARCAGIEGRVVAMCENSAMFALIRHQTPELMLAPFLKSVTEPRRRIISPRRLSGALNMRLGELARVAKVHRNMLARRPSSPRVQSRLAEIAAIIGKAAELIGDERYAVVWFRHQPLDDFAGRTAEQMITEGEGQAILLHLRALAEGAHA
jgi:uncharacterized protein (DUF2384 family)